MRALISGGRHQRVRHQQRPEENKPLTSDLRVVAMPLGPSSEAPVISPGPDGPASCAMSPSTITRRRGTIPFGLSSDGWSVRCGSRRRPRLHVLLIFVFVLGFIRVVDAA